MHCYVRELVRLSVTIHDTHNFWVFGNKADERMDQHFLGSRTLFKILHQTSAQGGREEGREGGREEGRKGGRRRKVRNKNVHKTR